MRAGAGLSVRLAAYRCRLLDLFHRAGSLPSLCGRWMSIARAFSRDARLTRLVILPRSGFLSSDDAPYCMPPMMLRPLYGRFIKRQSRRLERVDFARAASDDRHRRLRKHFTGLVGAVDIDDYGELLFVPADIFKPQPPHAAIFAYRQSAIALPAG